MANNSTHVNIGVAVCYYFLLLLSESDGKAEIKIGVLVDKGSVHTLETIKEAVQWVNTRTLEREKNCCQLKPISNILEETDSFAISNAICHLLGNGVQAIIGVYKTSALSTIQSYSDTFKVPFLTLSTAPNSTSRDGFQIYMRPLSTLAVVDVMVEYQWKHVTYLYNSDEGLMRLQELFYFVHQHENQIEIDVKRINANEDFMDALEDIIEHSQERKENLLVDISVEYVIQAFKSMKKTRILQDNRINLLLTDAANSEKILSSLIGINVNTTAFQLVGSDASKNWRKKLTLNNSTATQRSYVSEDFLGIDAIDLLSSAFEIASYDDRVYDDQQYLKCVEKNIPISQTGETVMKILKQSRIKGFTGLVAFDENGHRADFSLDVIHTHSRGAIDHIGVWSARNHLSLYSTIGDFITTFNNRTKVVTVFSAPM